MAIIRLYPNYAERPPFVYHIPDKIASEIGKFWGNDFIQIKPSDGVPGLVFRPEDYLLYEIILTDNKQQDQEKTDETDSK